MSEHQEVAESRPAERRILIACIGNIFLGDDGFGCAVARQIQGRYPRGVEVVDFGIRGMELAYALLEAYDALILVDAVPRGGRPGTLYLLQPELPAIAPEEGLAAGRLALEAHSMDPLRVLAFARALGAPPRPTLLVGCEPASPASAEEEAEEDLQMGLSAPVQAAVSGAVSLLDTLVERLCSPAGRCS
jgi:hydrogenase maturation protease